MDGNLVERELDGNDDDLGAWYSGVTGAVKGAAKSAGSAALRAGKAAAGGALRRFVPGASGGGAAPALPPPPRKAPRGLFIALGVVGVLGLVAYMRGKKGRR
jgi:hypothetical protein